jgi:chromosome segregation protein
VIDELEKRLRSVKLAAGKARNFQEYSQRLRELKSRYVMASYHDLRTKQGALQSDAAELGEKSSEFRARLAEIEQQAADAQSKANELEFEIGAANDGLLSTQTQISGGNERIAAARHRITEQTHAAERAEKRMAALTEQLARLDEQCAEIHRRCDETDADIARLQARLTELQAAEREVSNELIERQTAMEEEKSGVIDLLRRTSTLNNEVSNLRRQHDSLAGQKEKLAARDAEIAHHLADLMSRRSQLESRRDEMSALIDEQNAALTDADTRATTVRADRGRIQEALSVAREFRGGLLARQKTLDELDRSREGLGAALRDVLAARDADPSGRTFSYVIGPVGELFETDTRYASIIEAVLGELEQYLVVLSRGELLNDRESLERIDGRVQTFCLDEIPAFIAPPNLRDQPGFIACALDWVRTAARTERLARYLLGRTIVVESVEDALRMSRMCPPGLRFVTMEGVVFESDGRVALGSLGAGTGIISRRSELREIHERITEVESRIASLEQRAAAADAESARLERMQRDLRAAIAEARSERSEAEATLRSIESQVERLSRERPLIASEAQQVANQMTEAVERERAGKQELESLEQTSARRHERIAGLQREIEERALRHREISEQATEARVAVGEAQQRRTALNDSLRTSETAVARARDEHDAAERERADVDRRVAEAKRTVAETETELARLKTEFDALTARIESLRAERTGHLETIERLVAEQRETRGDLETVDSDLGERRIRLGEIRTRIEDLEHRTREDLQVELAEMLADYHPEEDVDWPVVEAEMNALRGKIDRLGNVNLDAINEQEELESSVGHKSAQRDDLRESDAKLRELIARLDEESIVRFRKTFDEVRSHFGELFRKLFGGGRADITLQDDNDILECGIDIMAKPPGKELRSINLMSGGEKTMTAIALLMAVFRSRPSPFTLLDEVDAALDEANNERFNHVVREFLDQSQFIIITHSKRTMAIADVLYGVTMQEPGVSKQVAVRLEDVHEHEAA